jgi:predicted enzyme related to lactoylglutathione lyase
MALMDRVRLDVVWYLAENWDEMKDFYTRVLGLKPAPRHPAYEWLELETGGPVRLALSGSGPEDLHGGGVPVFAVEHLDAVLTELAAQNVTAEEPLPEPDGGLRATVYDPTGNRFQLRQPGPDTSATADGPVGTDGLVTGIDLLWYITPYPEWEDARRFWTETLGLGETFRTDTPPHWALFDTNTPVRLGLGTPEVGQMGPAGSVAVILEVSDMDQAMARLHKAGVEHSEDPADPGSRLVSFYDPAGNQVQLHWTQAEG